jgi:hypothetical protein
MKAIYEGQTHEALLNITIPQEDGKVYIKLS